MANAQGLPGGVEVVTIPAGSQFPWYFFKIQLAQTLYTLRLRFNSRMNRWIMDIADSQNNDILDSIPLLIGRNLTGRFAITALPDGFFFCTDDTNQDTEPTRFSFGSDHTLWFFDNTGTTI